MAVPLALRIAVVVHDYLVARTPVLRHRGRGGRGGTRRGEHARIPGDRGGGDGLGFHTLDEGQEPGHGVGEALVQFGIIDAAQGVNLSERVTPSARLQNRACDFRRTRLLNVFCFVMQHGTRDSLVTVSVEQLEVGLLVVPVVTVHMMHL